MHSPKRKPPAFTKTGARKGRKPLDEKTFTFTAHLDVRCSQWLQRQQYRRGVSQSKIMRELIVAEMQREAMAEYRGIEQRMDVLAGSS